MLRWLREAERVARTVLGLLAEALGQDAGWFDRWFDDEAVTTTKLVRYPAPPVGPGRRRLEQPGRRSAQGLRLARAGAPGRPAGPAGARRRRRLDRGHPGARTRWCSTSARPSRSRPAATCGPTCTASSAPAEGVDRYSVPFFLAPRLDAVVEPLALPEDLAAQARGVEQDPDEPDLRRSTAARRSSGGCARTPRSHAAGTPTFSRTRRGTPAAEARHGIRDGCRGARDGDVASPMSAAAGRHGIRLTSRRSTPTALETPSPQQNPTRRRRAGSPAAP